MFSRASLTIRILGISPGSLTTDSLEEKCREFGCTEEPKRWFSRGRYGADGHPLITSLARQGESDTATVSFPSNGLKQRALKKFSGAGLSTDDTFAGLTVLHSDPEPDLDICAIHGLNGNAFDTFAWGGRDMWLRDFLPKSWPQHADHKGVRVMAYGYSSLVQDDINTTGLDEWSMGLLQSVAAVRRSPSERSRPLVLVCHSLGGIVARQAMIRLEKFAPDGLQLKHCGLLFLSTPHLGTIEGNWNDFWLLFAKAAKVARGQAFTQLLSAFNQASVNAQELYSALRPIPPTECLYETQMTSVAGTKRLIVPPASAGLLKRAQPMLNVDHRTICKFPDMSNQGYLQVLDCIENVRKSVVTGQTRERQDGEGGEAVDGRTENSDTTGFIKGGNSVGGNARSDVPGGIAKGGPSTGGNINISPGYKGTKSLAGGDSKGGDAVGSVAFGGNSAGGNIVL